MRQYPALVNCTTIDWFSEWPADALLEVADKYLENTDMANEEEVCTLCLFINSFLAFSNDQRRYCDARRHAVCVSAALVSAAKVMRCIKCSRSNSDYNYNFKNKIKKQILEMQCRQQFATIAWASEEHLAGLAVSSIGLKGLHHVHHYLSFLGTWHDLHCTKYL